MRAEGCPCCSNTDASTSDSGRSTDPWIADEAVLDADLPPELQSALGRFLDESPVPTLGEWAREVRRRTGGGSIDFEALCHTDGITEHRGRVGDREYHFACFYDAVILAAITEEPVEIRTQSPDGTTIEADADGDGTLTVRPEGAVFSFGIDDRAVTTGRDRPTLEDGYAAICPYVRAFPDREAYQRWAASVPAATVAMPLAGATDLAAALVAEADTPGTDA